ncbi:MarR family transcriptional regulator [Streptomyces sp. NBC_01317]|uniref:MarR family winged helix-turn-helix transcriptional regulator n=1 Tax=Streptomyces sp. NBC_01317 TaxID=2903822 RepID=UPI002E112FAE|nr:MarR family transcriptional regulator [Streptomyces sp. NBC_01317]
MNEPPTHATPAASINIASRTLARLNDRRLRPLGLAFGQVPVLAALGQGEALPQKELVKLARIEQPSMAQLLARMERDGLIRRTPSTQDRRVSMISLTETGLATLPQVLAALHETNSHALRGFSDLETEVLQSLLDRLLANLDADLDRGPQEPDPEN